MTHSSLTNQIRLSSQSSSRNGTKIDTFLIHHQAGTNDDQVINAMVSGSKEVSANYTISNEGRLTLVVDEDLRAWTSGSSKDGGKGAQWDRRSITVEIENEAGAPNWPISNAAIETAAKLLVDLRARYGITNVLGHRDLWTNYRASYPTFCPGPDTVNRIVARANELSNGGFTAGGAQSSPAPSTSSTLRTVQGDGISYQEPTGELANRISRALIARGRLPKSYPVDGNPGPEWRKGVQRTLINAGLWSGTPDGLLGPRNLEGVQRYAARFGDYSGPIDKDPGINSWTGFALGLERP